MPFTPFHFGPALLVKSFKRKFSFTIFVFSQVIMDLEPLYFMVRHDWPAHRLFHTFLGCNIPVITTILMGKPVCEILLRIWNSLTSSHLETRISWKAAAISAAIGAYSHVLLDGLMHRDMHPFRPFSEQVLTGFVAGQTVMWFCVICAFATLVIFSFKNRKRI